MHSIAVFDDGSGLLSPLTDLRAVFDVRTGALTTLERMRLRAQQASATATSGLVAPDHLAAMVREQHPGVPVNGCGKMAGTVLLVNGACPLADFDAAGLECGEALVDEGTGVVVKAHVRADDGAVERICRGELGGLSVKRTTAAVLSRPWHVRAHRDACIAADLELVVRSRSDWRGWNGKHAAEAGLFISSTAIVHPSVIFDATDKGKRVVVDEHAVIRPGAILVGPCYVGPHSSVLERSLVKASTAIGPQCKVAGEVGGTIFQGFANKAHEGHLGDSWVGEWANLGAGTTNSNLLNTYGDVICRPLGSGGAAVGNERTGQQFLGAMIGDHVKTAICTRIMTGAIVGTGTMFAASSALSGTIPALSWITDSGTKPFAVEKFIEIARTVMGRRKMTPSEQYVARLRELGGRR